LTDPDGISYTALSNGIEESGEGTDVCPYAVPAQYEASQMRKRLALEHEGLHTVSRRGR
jgi:hypothetical protein